MKMKNNGKLLALLLALILGLSLMVTGCGQSGDGEETGSEDPVISQGDEETEETEEADGVKLSTWTPMDGGQPVNYFLNAAIEYQHVTDEAVAEKMADVQGMENSEDIYLSGSYYAIDGLVDETVEAEINAQIYEMYLDMCQRTELPGYRGIKVIERNGSLADISIFPGNIGYCGNLLSVSFQKTWSYQVDDQWHWIRDNEYAVFDMKTGGRVTLESLFGDDVDHLEFLGELIKKQLPAVVDEQMSSYEHNGAYVWNDGSIVQVAPFEGVRKDQPFQVDYQGITLYFDEKDPEFDTDFGGFSGVTINYTDMKEEAVYPVRFMAEQELYTQPVQVMMVYNYNSKNESQHTFEKNLEKTIECNWPKNLSVEDRDEMIERDRSVIMDTINGWYINNAVKIQETWGYISYYCNVTEIGEYYSVEHSLYGGVDGENMEQCIRRIYNKKNLKEVPLESLFVPGYDLRGALIDQIADEMVSMEGRVPGMVMYTPEEAWDGRMASLNMYGISFEFPVNDFGGRVSLYKDYSSLGLENMRMFQ